MAISTNQKPTIYRNLYENTVPGLYDRTSYDIYRRLRIGRVGHLDQSEAYTIYLNLYENMGPIYYVNHAFYFGNNFYIAACTVKPIPLRVQWCVTISDNHGN